MILIDYLVNEGYNHKKAKFLLTNELVLVNDKVIRKYDYNVRENDVVRIKKSISNDIEIIYEDKNIIVVNKPHNLLTVSTEKEKEKTLYHQVSRYLKNKNKNAKVFIIHRLDKETSGLIMFAKDEKTKNTYQNNWDNLVKYRGYIAVVENKMKKKNGTLSFHLKENINHKVYVDMTGKLAITSYKVLKENDLYSLVDIEIQTGRKNQIRASLAEIGNPIVGDIKYGAKRYKDLLLTAYKLEVINPINKKLMEFSIDIPKNYKGLVK